MVETVCAPQDQCTPISAPSRLIVPAILPEELADGYIARLRIVNDFRSTKDLFNALKETAPELEFVPKVQVLALLSGIPLKEFVCRHTLTPFKRAFGLVGGRKLKEILRDPHFTGDLSDVIKEIVKIRSYSDENNSPHFFEVELNKVGRLKNDLLLNEDEVRSYLAQVGPVPFHPEFELGEIIESKLTEFGNFRTYNITINDGRGSVYRPHQSEFSITENLKDQFTNVEFFEVLGQNGNPDAIGWMLNHSYYGAINKKYGLAGVRLRTGNIQVGSPEIAAHVFPETRFNSWAVGEVHVLTDKVLPNGRRDDFEYSVHYQNLLGQVSVIASSISKKCRDKSNARNRVKAARDFLTRCKSELGVASNEEFSVISRKLAIDKGEHLGHLARKVICSDLFVAGDKLELMDELETIEREARKIKEALNLESQEHKLNQEYFDIFGHIHDICRDSNEAHRIVEQLLTRLK